MKSESLFGNTSLLRLTKKISFKISLDFKLELLSVVPSRPFHHYMTQCNRFDSNILRRNSKF